MGHSSLLGLEIAAVEPAGRDTASLGPGDNSDSGSDRVGLEDSNADDPVERHPAQRGVDAADAGTADIGVDRIFTPGPPSGDADLIGDDAAGRMRREDEDDDLDFIDAATAPDPLDSEPGGDEEERPLGGLGDEDDNIPGAHETRRPTTPGPNPAPDAGASSPWGNQNPRVRKP